MGRRRLAGAGGKAQETPQKRKIPIPVTA